MSSKVSDSCCIVLHFPQTTKQRSFSLSEYFRRLLFSKTILLSAHRDQNKLIKQANMFTSICVSVYPPYYHLTVIWRNSEVRNNASICTNLFLFLDQILSTLTVLWVNAFCETFRSSSNTSQVCIIHTCHPVVHTNL